MNIRRIAKDDLGSIKSLWEKLNAHHLSRSTYFKRHFSGMTFERRTASLTKKDNLVVYLAEEDGRNVGYCIATVHDGAGEVDSIFVGESYRGDGLGYKLLSLALKWLEDHECETIRVSIAEGNESAMEFYRKAGFAERLIVMQKNR